LSFFKQYDYKKNQREIDFFSYSVAIIAVFMMVHPSLIKDEIENALFIFLMLSSIYLVVMDRQLKKRKKDPVVKVKINKETDEIEYWIGEEKLNEEQIVLYVKFKMNISDEEANFLIKELKRKSEGISNERNQNDDCR